MAKEKVASGMPTQRVVQLTGVPASTLNSWVRQRLCVPSLVGGGGKRATRYWSVRDVVIVRVIRSLREVGCPLSVLRRVSRVLKDEWGASLSDTVMWWDGQDVLTVTAAGDVVSLAAHRGQSLVRETVTINVSCPISAWEEKFALEAEPVSVAEIKARRARKESSPAGRMSRGASSAWR